jgi:hypothetical protein
MDRGRKADDRLSDEHEQNVVARSRENTRGMNDSMTPKNGFGGMGESCGFSKWHIFVSLSFYEP